MSGRPMLKGYLCLISITRFELVQPNGTAPGEFESLFGNHKNNVFLHGLEPRSSEPKSDVLPLHHRKINKWRTRVTIPDMRIFSPPHTPCLLILHSPAQIILR